MAPNVAAERLEFPLGIREVPSSNLGTKTGCTDWGLRGFPQSFQESASIVP
jgi:hypothetical protein